MKLIIGFLILIISIFIILIGEASFTDGKLATVLLSTLSLIMMRHIKWVYHDDLGYFLASFQDEKVIIYKQKILCIKELFDVDNNGNIDDVSKSIKIELDRIYSNKIIKEKRENEIKTKINTMKKWDGYLDKSDRRNGKIKKILK
jgi:hypothetical protein